MCAIDGCGKKIVARGFCGSHYTKARRKGLAKLDRGEGMVNKRFWIKADQFRALGRIARSSGRNYSDLIRSAIDHFLGKN